MALLKTEPDSFTQVDTISFYYNPKSIKKVSKKIAVSDDGITFAKIDTFDGCFADDDFATKIDPTSMLCVHQKNTSLRVTNKGDPYFSVDENGNESLLGFVLQDSIAFNDHFINNILITDIIKYSEWIRHNVDKRFKQNNFSNSLIITCVSDADCESMEICTRPKCFDRRKLIFYIDNFVFFQLIYLIIDFACYYVIIDCGKFFVSTIVYLCLIIGFSYRCGYG